jgi:SAM-dependent methyltransferase
MFKQDTFYKKKEADAFFLRNKTNQKEIYNLISKNLIRKSKLEIYNILKKKIKLNKNIKILEIGCYIGDLLYYLKKKNKCKVYGVEPSKKACQISKNIFSLKIENKTFFESKFFALNKKNLEFFDLIICDDVLSWLDRDLIIPTFGVIDWLLKKKGYLFFRDFTPKINFAHPNHHWKKKNIFNFKCSDGHKKFFIESGKYIEIFNRKYFSTKMQKIKIKNRSSMIWSDTIIKKINNFTHKIIKI